MTGLRSLQLLSAFLMISFICGACNNKARPHNVVLFVADGLRAKSVTSDVAPTMLELRNSGVNFDNPHSLYPTITMANASGLSTGHFIGDTRTTNVLYAGRPIKSLNYTVTPFLEDDVVLREMDADFHTDFLNEETLLSAARKKGFSTAAIGKVGPTFLFDHTMSDDTSTIVIDDSTGTDRGIPLNTAILSKDIRDKLFAGGLSVKPHERGENGNSGKNDAGTSVDNHLQQDDFVNAAVNMVLPLFKERNKPFVLVFWSRDPDGTQHNQGDSQDIFSPGINGPTSKKAVRNADHDLEQLQNKLKELGLLETTDIIVVADHGFSTISKVSGTSEAAKYVYNDPARYAGRTEIKGELPPGFLAIDLSKGLNMPLWDPDNSNARLPFPNCADSTALCATRSYPSKCNGILGDEPGKPKVVVVGNGGSDMIYLPDNDKALAAQIVSILAREDYTSGIFVDDDLGSIPGTLPLSSINLKPKGSSSTTPDRPPSPSIIVSFRSFPATGCDPALDPLQCTVEVADTTLHQGQGNHGSFSRSDTMNFMAARGPDFKEKFVDEAPVSNADIGRTIAALLGLDIQSKGNLMGRIITEAQPNGRMPEVTSTPEKSALDDNGRQTILQVQMAGGERYFDAAGYDGRTVGLPSPAQDIK
jgi:hypothetical protein